MKEFNSPNINQLAIVFRNMGKELYMVGGAVRDMMMGKEPHDFDFATNASTDEMRSMFLKTLPIGEKHGTITVSIDDEFFEVTTYRIDGTYSDGRRPDFVIPARKIENDLARRDFTMNAIAYDPLKRTFQDPFAGVIDITDKTIRCVGDAKDRFREDGLRIMRAVRFMAQLEFTLDQGIISAFEDPEIINMLDKVSPERIRDEFNKILMTNMPYSALILMHKYRILDKFIPELRVCDGQRQNEHHKHDVLKHIFLTTAETGALDAPFHVRLAALLHDIGKPATAKLKDDGVNYSFYEHEIESAKIARKILERLRYPNVVIAKVIHLVEVHMLPLLFDSIWKNAALRRFVIKVGVENLEDLYLLNVADLYASGTHDLRLLEKLKERVKIIMEAKPTVDARKLSINGNDLLSIGYKQGPVIGEVLKKLFDQIIEYPELDNRETLLNMAISMKDTM